MRYLLLLLAICQISTKSFAQQRCSYTTDGSAASLGLKIKFSVPCNWKDEGNKKNNLKMYQMEADDYGIIAAMSIKKPNKPPTTESLNELTTKEHYKKLNDKGGMFLWGRKLKIDGLDCAEVAVKMKKKVMFMEIHTYLVRYMFYYKNQAVNITYTVTGETDKDAAKYFNENKALFLALATETDFM